MEVSCVLRPSAFELERLTAWAFGIWFSQCFRAFAIGAKARPRGANLGRKSKAGIKAAGCCRITKQLRLSAEEACP